MKKPELLAPAGNFEKLKIALLYGADAVYVGAPALGLRAKAGFSAEDLVEAVEYTHRLGKKIYLTLNLFAKDADQARLDYFIEISQKVKADGLIIADPGVFDYIKSAGLDIPLHISTQANVSSANTAKFWKNQGASLCVLARELSIKEAADIKRAVGDFGIEIFIHGAMCMAMSGRCLISAYTDSRSGNRGACNHACRKSYSTKLVVTENEGREVEPFDLFEDEDGSYLFNSKDLCLMPVLNEVLAAGFDSLKIEGRNKSLYYVGAVTRIYRQAIDQWFANPTTWSADAFVAEVATLQNRGYTLGFAHGFAGKSAQTYDSTESTSQYRTAGFIREVTESHFTLEIKHKLRINDVIEILSPHQFEPIRYTITEIYDIDRDTLVNEKNPGQTGWAVRMPLPNNVSPTLFPVYTLTRIRVKE
ncbi:U32 family peptidase [Entomospira entomophila]|nr:peptidase U32 family protein [Entomospira entomophilus]WDI36159.1 U32 family peptidase [Entomospira entomophilus]